MNANTMGRMLLALPIQVVQLSKIAVQKFFFILKRDKINLLISISANGIVFLITCPIHLSSNYVFAWSKLHLSLLVSKGDLFLPATHSERQVSVGFDQGFKAAIIFIDSSNEDLAW